MRETKPCVQCGKPRWAYLRCQHHAGLLIRNHPEEVARLGTLTRQEKEAEAAKLILKRQVREASAKPKWEYENPEGEAELMRLAAVRDEQ